MVENRVGPPVRGKNCYGREEFIALLWEKLRVGHVLLAAPRRFGKTSVMYRLMDEPKAGYKLIHADLEHLSEPAELITQLVVQLANDSALGKLARGLSFFPAKLWERFTRAFEEVALLNFKLKLKQDLKQRWQESGEEVFAAVTKSSDVVVFVLDEFPMMIDRMASSDASRENARTLLRWLRALRIGPGCQNVRFLVGGSIGIGHVLNKLSEPSAMNDLEQMRLGPFPPKVGAAFLDEMAASEGAALSRPCKKAMLELIGTLVPYFIQVLFSEVIKAQRLDGVRVTPNTIEEIYRNKVLGVDCKTYFDHYYGRLRDYYRPNEERVAKRMLRQLAPGPLNRDACYQLYKELIGDGSDVEEFNRLMTDLENDFYVRFDAGDRKYEFSCKLLRDWWLRHYGMEA